MSFWKLKELATTDKEKELYEGLLSLKNTVDNIKKELDDIKNTLRNIEYDVKN